MTYHITDILSLPTLELILDDLRSYAYSELGTVFYFGAKRPPRWFMWVVDALYHPLLRLYLSKKPRRVWVCPTCGRVVAATRETVFGRVVSICGDGHLWDGITGEALEPSRGDVSYQAYTVLKGCLEHFGSDGRFVFEAGLV